MTFNSKKCNNCGMDKERILIKLRDNNGLRAFCPNCIAEMILNDTLKLENSPLIKDCITGHYGAVLFKSGNETYQLEKDAMLRLLAHGLTSKEYFVLSKKYGDDKFMLHDDFYDPDTGEAFQSLLS